MNERSENRTYRLGFFTIFWLLFSVPAAYAWLVNVEVVLGWPAAPQWPAPVYRLARELARDLTTIMWLAPLLALGLGVGAGAYELLSSWFRRGDDRSTAADRSCYPAHFGHFLIMLGLVGTFIGMQIALSGADLTIERLLRGTSTAILSSLGGIIAAFLTYVLDRWFCWASRPPKVSRLPDPVQALSEFVESLSSGANAADTWAQQLTQRAAELAQLFQETSATRRAVEATNSKCDGLDAQLRTIGQCQELLLEVETERLEVERERLQLEKERKEGQEQYHQEVLKLLRQVVDSAQNAEQDRRTFLEAVVSSFNGSPSRRAESIRGGAS